MNSLLVVADDLGHLHWFLDGSYPLGAIQLSPVTSTASLFKNPKQPVFLAHPQKSVDSAVFTELRPTSVELPLLKTRKARDLAKLSSTTRELVWYVTRVVKEMRAVWFGSDTSSGARELGPKWIRALESKQKDQFNRESHPYTLATFAKPRALDLDRGGAEWNVRFNVPPCHGSCHRLPCRLLGKRRADE